MAPARPAAPRRRTRAKASPPALARAQVPAAVRTITAPAGVARFAAGKALCRTAQQHPDRLYPYFDELAALLRSDSKIVRWNATQIVASLASVDAARKLDSYLDEYLAFISSGDLISAANAIRGAGRIASSRPDLVDRIIPAILAVEHATFETPECRNVAIGQALDALLEIGPSAYRRPDAAAFVRRQRSNRRAAVAHRATRMIAAMPPGP